MGSIDEDPAKCHLMGEEEMATVFFSDVHCGDSKSKHKQLLEYLQSRRAAIDKVVIVGDLLDLWVASIGQALSEAQPLLEYLSAEYGDNVYYILGNHDTDLLPLKKVLPKIHTSLQFPIGNKKAVALHGHVIDPDPYVRTRFSHYMAWFINKFDRWAKVDVRKSLVSLSERIQNDPYDKMIAGFEQRASEVFNGRFDYVITGHTHLYPYIKKLTNLYLINIGDNLQHTTLLHADSKGFSLIDYSRPEKVVGRLEINGEKEFLFRSRVRGS